MKIVVIVVVLVAAGCAAPGDVRRKAPSVETTSAQSAKAVTGCVSDRLEAAGFRGVSVRPTSNGYALTGEADLGLYGKDTAFVIDVDDTKAGSSTRLYSNMAFTSDTDRVGQMVRNCQR